MTKRQMETVGSEFRYGFDNDEGEVEEDWKAAIPFLTRAECGMMFTCLDFSGRSSFAAIFNKARGLNLTPILVE